MKELEGLANNDEKGNLNMVILKKEISTLSNNIHTKLQNLDKFKNNLHESEQIQEFLKQICNLLKNNSNLKEDSKEMDFGLKAFEKFHEFIEKYKFITDYELKKCNLIETFISFLMDETVSISEECSYFIKEEVKCEFDKIESNYLNNCNGTDIEVTNKEMERIIRRLFVFFHVMLRKSPNNPKGINLRI